MSTSDSGLQGFALSLLAYEHGFRPSAFRRLFFCSSGFHREHTYALPNTNRGTYKYCVDCGKNECIERALVYEILSQKPTPLTDDYLRYVFRAHDNDPEKTSWDLYWIMVVVAMDACRVKTIEEWDDFTSSETRSLGFEKAQARIARILFQDGKLSQEKATELGAFN